MTVLQLATGDYSLIWPLSPTEVDYQSTALEVIKSPLVTDYPINMHNQN